MLRTAQRHLSVVRLRGRVEIHHLEKQRVLENNHTKVSLQFPFQNRTKNVEGSVVSVTVCKHVSPGRGCTARRTWCLGGFDTAPPPQSLSSKQSIPASPVLTFEFFRFQSTSLTFLALLFRLSRTRWTVANSAQLSWAESGTEENGYFCGRTSCYF